MADIYFSRKESPPGEPDLRKVLGDLYTAYKQMLTLTAEFHHEWKYYGTKIGWQLKVARKGKAILYLTPLQQSFRIGMAVLENERDALLQSRLPAAVKRDLTSAGKYPEGYPLRLAITTPGDMKTIRIVLELLRESR